MLWFLIMTNAYWSIIQRLYSNLFDSPKSEDDSPFILLDNSNAEEDGDGESQNNQDD